MSLALVASSLSTRPVVLICVATYVPFRLPEIHSVAAIVGAQLHVLAAADDSTYVVVLGFTPTTLGAFLARIICVRLAVELWGTGPTPYCCVSAIQTAMAARPPADTMPYMAADSTFALEFDCYGVKLASAFKSAMMHELKALPFAGRVDLKNPRHVFECLVEHDLRTPGLALTAVSFGRLLGRSRRSELVGKFDLRGRKLIGNTSMEPELSLVMANMARAQPGVLIFDPFCGTGSMLLTSAEFGATVLGGDICEKVLHGWGKTSRCNAPSKSRTADENISATFKQYGTSHRFLGLMQADSAKPPWRAGLGPMFSAIVTDPPYGIREMSRRGHKDAADHWEITDLFDYLLDFSAQYLELNGHLVFWLPYIKGEYSDDQVPTHSALAVVANSWQDLGGKLGRRLITMVKTQPYDAVTMGVVHRSTVSGMQAALHDRVLGPRSAPAPAPPGTAVRDSGGGTA